MNNFVVLKVEEILKLSDQDKIVYYSQLKEYMRNLPYDHEKMDLLMRNYIKTVKLFGRFVDFLCRPTVINRERIPEGNGIIFTANHLGSFDQFPIVVAIGKRPINFIMKDTLFTAKELYRGYLFQKLGAIPVNVTTADGRANAQNTMIQIMLHGGNTIYFPEGSRGTKREHYDKDLPLPFQKGAVVNAQITGSIIVPLSINNNYKLLRRNNIVVRVNEPMFVSSIDNVPEATAELRRRTIEGIKLNQEEGYKIYRKNKNGHKELYRI